MPDLLLELFSEEIPARPSARSATSARTDKTENSMRAESL
jgi:glycyl-tRNA synthetase beta subunit